MSEHLQAIYETISRTDKRLWNAYAVACGDSQATARGGIRFPFYREASTKSVRFSEQESRFAFIEELAQVQLPYSVETPTTQLYQFTGEEPLSAQTDVTVYEPDESPLMHLEFKAKGITVNRRDKAPIQKDIEKLLREPLPGLWFHSLEGVGKSTLADFWTAFTNDIQQVAAKPNLEIKSRLLVVHICVARQKFSIQTRIDTSELASLGQWTIPSYKVSRSELLEMSSNDKWAVHREE